MKSVFQIAILSVFLIIGYSVNGLAQFHIGVKAGLNQSQLDYDEPELQGYDFKNMSGINVGLLLKYDLSKSISLKLEPVYSTRGTKYSTEQRFLTGGTVLSAHEFIQTLSFIDVPLFFQYTLLLNSELKPFGFIGPQFSYLVDGEIEYKDNVSSRKTETKSEFKSTELGISFGLGIEYKMGPGNLILDIRYLKGLTNLNNPEGGDIYSYGHSYNIGYGIKL